jgi:hypothetical protein
VSKPDFIICAPLRNARESNGILALVSLAHSIEKAGRTVQICVTGSFPDEGVAHRVDFDSYVPHNDVERQFIEDTLEVRDRYGLRLLKDFSPQTIESSYVIYPEVILDNPLNATKVIRYFGNKNGILKEGAMVNIGPDDFVLAHSKMIDPSAHHVAFFARQDPLFHNAGTHPTADRKLDITYIGKGVLYGVGGTVPNTLALTRSWPTEKAQLAMLLRNCRFFYTGDAWSNINVEALACGAVPVFLHNGPWTDEEIDGTELGALPRVSRNTGNTSDPSFFKKFDVRRTRFLNQVKTVEREWDQRVAELIEKADDHFAVTAAA